MGEVSYLADRGPLGLYSDAARRAADVVNLHLAADPTSAGRWVALRLSDGGSDGVLYDSKRDAIRHQLHETQCAYLFVPPDGLTPKQAAAFLEYNRRLYDAGARMPDPERETAFPPIDQLRVR